MRKKKMVTSIIAVNGENVKLNHLRTRNPPSSYYCEMFNVHNVLKVIPLINIHCHVYAEKHFIQVVYGSMFLRVLTPKLCSSFKKFDTCQWKGTVPKSRLTPAFAWHTPNKSLLDVCVKYFGSS
ncbi:hypothetical protein CEXT_549771 [Caerostris extrusa]|uniref:Uncharacterized protein n=1 Tax=Caerostris extrusa TaxID=172846 RepID=A0AAV4MRB1_CAEEX|nr:hypothetical protein CEXT_549771 [Caerostris extrusa]